MVEQPTKIMKNEDVPQGNVLFLSVSAVDVGLSSSEGTASSMDSVTGRLQKQVFVCGCLERQVFVSGRENGSQFSHTVGCAISYTVHTIVPSGSGVSSRWPRVWSQENRVLQDPRQRSVPCSCAAFRRSLFRVRLGWGGPSAQRLVNIEIFSVSFSMRSHMFVSCSMRP